MSEEFQTNFDLKKAIEAEGLYEPGMTISDMKQIFNTLNRSKHTATNEDDYRELLNRTDMNCTNIEILKENSPTDVVEIDKSSSDNVEISTTLKTIQCTPKGSKKKEQQTKNINVFSSTAYDNYKPLKPRLFNNHPSIYYHQESILKLPIKEKAKLISKFLIDFQKIDETNPKIKMEWGKPIIPQPNIKFNGDLCVDFQPDTSDDEKSVVESEKKSPDSEDFFIISRPKRQIKRKNYADFLASDDEDSNSSHNKKTKTNNTESPNVTLKSIDSKSSESSPDIKWITRKPKLKNPSKTNMSLAGASDRTNKIFDKLKREEDTKKNKSPFSFLKSAKSQNSSENMEYSDSGDEIFPEIQVTANVHKEPVAKNQNKNNQARKTQEKKSDSPEISTLDFYGTSREIELDVSNNNKSSSSENKTKCPICCRFYSNSEIEFHASRCEQFEDDSTELLCEICNKKFPMAEITAHRFECLEQITEESVIVNEPTVTRSKTNKGYLCSVCDKYVLGVSEIQHANSCIASLNP